MNVLKVGVDIGKDGHDVGITDAEDNVIARMKVSNSIRGYQKLCGLIGGSIKEYKTEEVVIAMEASGHWWYCLYSRLIKDYRVRVVNPLQVSKCRQAEMKRAKTDRIDAILLARISDRKELREVIMPEIDILRVREWCRYRVKLVENQSDIKRQIRSVMDYLFPEYEAMFSDFFGKTSQVLLREYTTPWEVSKLSQNELTAIMNKHSRGKLGKPKAEEILKTAETSFGVDPNQGESTERVRYMLQHLGFIEHQIAEVEGKIKRYFSNIEDYITTIPGFEVILAATIHGEVGDFGRFKNPNKLVAFAGLEPRVYQSGKYEVKGHASKRGSPTLRWALCQAANISRHRIPRLQRLYTRKRKEGKSHSSAITAVAVKLTHIVYAVMKNKEPYREEQVG